ncbi:hypothetical protein INR49_007032, partial [Caranx melampygus]
MRRNTQQPTVTFQNPHVSPSAEDDEEVDHVNAAVISENNLPAILDEKRRSLTQALPTIAVSWLILSVILALDIYFTSVISDNNTKLTEENMQLISDNEKLLENDNNLPAILDEKRRSLTQALPTIALTEENMQLNEKNQELNEKIQNLTTENQELKTQSNILKQQIQDKETEWSPFNVSRAQWSINAYCPIQYSRRKCRPCQTGWIQKESSCYAVNDPEPSGQKNWTEAQGNCRGKGSDLVVIADEREKDDEEVDHVNAAVISENNLPAILDEKRRSLTQALPTIAVSWVILSVILALDIYSDETEKRAVTEASFGSSGFWIGLRVVDGKWKWVDGITSVISDNNTKLTEENMQLNEKNQELNEKIQNLTTENQELKTQSNILKQQIQDKETELIQFNVSRAQWSINAYCRIDSSMKTVSTLSGCWIHEKSSCYAFNDAKPPGQKTWTEAQGNCRGKGSDLVVIADETEKSSQKLTGELDAVFRMRRNTQQPTVTFQNPHVSPSAEDDEEVDHVNAAVISENNLPAILDEKRRSLTQALPTIAVSWLILSRAVNEASFGPYGFWIGLRVVDGKWKWVDGSELKKELWTEPPNDGQCAVLFKNHGWRSVSCEDDEEVDHVNAAVISENNLPAILDEKRRSLTQALPTIAVSWLILSVILALDIYFTSVISDNNTKLTEENMQLISDNEKLLEKLKFNQTALLEENHNLTEHNNRLRRQCRPCQTGWRHEKSSCYAFNDYPPPEQKTWTEAQENCRGKGSDLVVIADETEERAVNEASFGSSGFWIGLRVVDGKWKWVDGKNMQLNEKNQELNEKIQNLTTENQELKTQSNILTQQIQDKETELIQFSRYIKNNPYGNQLWIGLRAVDGKWKWVDGSELKKELWRTQPAAGQCAVSVTYEGWRSVSCGERKQWICELAALSFLTALERIITVHPSASSTAAARSVSPGSSRVVLVSASTVVPCQ